MKRRRLLLAAAIVAGLVLAATVAVVASATARTFALNGLFAAEARLRPQHLAETQRSVDDWIPPGAVLLAGDSLIAMLPARHVDSRAVNLGVGGATTADVRARLRGRDSLQRARALILLVGTNDLTREPVPAEPEALLAEIPPRLAVIVCTVPPIDPTAQRDRTLAGVSALNERWRRAAAARPNTVLAPTERALADPSGALRRELHQGDGLHLNAEGNRRLAALLRETLAQLP